MEFKPVIVDTRTNRSFTCKLTEAQYEELKAFAAGERTDMTAVIRLALDEFLTRIRRERAA